MSDSGNAFLFDLDGTLIDSVYQHVLAWHQALQAEHIELSIWRIHRKIGMSGGLFADQLLREITEEVTPSMIKRLAEQHAEAYRRVSSSVVPLPGARQLLDWLTEAKIPWAIATSGRLQTAAPNLEALGVDPEKSVVVTRDQVRFAKPDPDLFIEAARRLGFPIERSIVVGDSIWDMLAAARCRALGVGLLSGGYGLEELQNSGALRVYEDPADLHRHIDEIASRTRGGDA
jgi:HAD superfamily hydrolase (TIGR01509 family)